MVVIKTSCTLAGNLLIGFSILMTGGSPSRVIRMFEHIGIGCISLRTYFEYQRVSKFNGIYFSIKQIY